MNAEPLAPEPGTAGVAGRAQAVRRLELRDFRNYAHVVLAPRLGPVVRATAQDTRSQARNRELALERLASRLASALVVQRPRRQTKPSGAPPSQLHAGRSPARGVSTPLCCL